MLVFMLMSQPSSLAHKLLMIILLSQVKTRLKLLERLHNECKECTEQLEEPTRAVD